MTLSPIGREARSTKEEQSIQPRDKSPLRWRVTPVWLLVTEEVVRCSRQCPYPTPPKPPVKFGTTSKLLRRRTSGEQCINHGNSTCSHYFLEENSQHFSSQREKEKETPAML